MSYWACFIHFLCKFIPILYINHVFWKQILNFKVNTFILRYNFYVLIGENARILEFCPFLAFLKGPLCKRVNIKHWVSIGHTMYYISIFYYIVQTVYYILYSTAKKAQISELYYILSINWVERTNRPTNGSARAKTRARPL